MLVQSSSLQRPTLPRKGPFKAQPTVMLIPLNLRNTPTFSTLNIYSLGRRHAFMFQYLRSILKTLCARGNGAKLLGGYGLEAIDYILDLYCLVCHIYFTALLSGSNKRCCENYHAKYNNACPIGILLTIAKSASQCFTYEVL